MLKVILLHLETFSFRDIMFQYVFTSNAFNKYPTNFQWPSSNGSGATSTVNTLISINTDVVAEHFNKETKGRANHFQLGCISDRDNGL